MKLLAFGLCAGAGFQAWRNIPPDGPGSTDAAFLVLFVATLAAFAAGYRLGRPYRVSATATAVASADASAASQSTVNLAVVMPGAGAGSAPMRVAVPTSALPWMGEDRPQLSADDFDGAEVAELLQDSDTEASR